MTTPKDALPEGVVIMREPTDALTKALIEARAATDAEVRLMRDAMLAGRVLVELIDQERAAADRVTDTALKEASDLRWHIG